MKIWHCNYDWNGSWGAYETAHYHTVADTKEEAIEYSMASHKEKTNIRDWTATEIPTNEKMAYYITGCSS